MQYHTNHFDQNHTWMDAIENADKAIRNLSNEFFQFMKTFTLDLDERDYAPDDIEEWSSDWRCLILYFQHWNTARYKERTDRATRTTVGTEEYVRVTQLLPYVFLLIIDELALNPARFQPAGIIRHREPTHYIMTCPEQREGYAGVSVHDKGTVGYLRTQGLLTGGFPGVSYPPIP